MKKLLPGSFILVLIAAIVLLQTSSCSKSNSAAAVCDVRGIYTGTNLANGVSSPILYDLENNNFAVGSTTPGSSPVTFGSYTNTCDSVKLSVYYGANGHYYSLNGKLSGTTISGKFYDLTLVSDSGHLVSRNS